MALNDYPVIIDLSTGETVKDFFTNVGFTLPPIKQGDSLRLLVSAVVRNPNANADVSRPWKYVDLPANLRAGVGVVGSAPETGTFTLTYGGDTTSALAYNATAAQVASALDALTSINSAGGVSVSGEAGGPYRVVFTNVGSRTDITGNGDLLYPVTSITVVESRAGTASIPEIQTIILERQADAYTDSFSSFPSASVAISTIQEGATDVPDVQQITLDPPPHGGTFTLTFDGETTGAIAYDATAEDVQEALEGLAGIAADGADITVTGVSPTWQVSFHGALTGDQPAMTGSATGLEVAKGKIGVLDLNTDGIATLVGAGTTTVSLEIESTDEPVTLLQQQVELINDLIPNSPVGSTPLPEYMLKSVYDPQGASKISGHDGDDDTGDGGAGGILSFDGGDANGSANGGAAGSITMNGADAATSSGGSAGSINTSGGNPVGASPGNDGGSINTSGGAAGPGGSINTSNGGGSIDTTGVGDIEMGENGTRTHLQGSATSNRFITLPNQTCTLAAAGAVGSSGITMATARLLGRTTASTGAVEEITVGSGLSLAAGVLSSSGILRQVVIVTPKTDTATGADTSPFTVYSGSITPTASDSKIIALVFGCATNTFGEAAFARIANGSTALQIGDAASSRERAFVNLISHNSNFLALPLTVTGWDAPGSTSAQTYNLQIWCQSGNWYLNRSPSDTDNNFNLRGATQMFLFEVAP